MSEVSPWGDGMSVGNRPKSNTMTQNIHNTTYSYIFLKQKSKSAAIMIAMPRSFESVRGSSFCTVKSAEAPLAMAGLPPPMDKARTVLVIAAAPSSLRSFNQLTNSLTFVHRARSVPVAAAAAVRAASAPTLAGLPPVARDCGCSFVVQEWQGHTGSHFCLTAPCRQAWDFA